MRAQPGGGPPRGQVSPAVIDGVFRALSDPTRRDVVGRLSARSATVSDLAATYDMALSSFVEHLNVLERSGLVRSHKTGRVRTYELIPEQLRMAEDWLTRQRTLWERRLDQLDSYLMKMKQERTK
ncbi:helix-turn-helix transcriptional regulator [Bradyrhizobium sp. U87765 SZCCT0131]|uniref:ArsR/SmtB family transcription factor n=1 Tax=unclassified Bradyrhizobium TaxID=2631580 RepID=UPI001BAA7DD5|nr:MULTISPECIES: metalloregulator ArsR/SmtB family transcription factor [unclassified Bradyrhizobium]MBR1219312.1 helix-turn-helix transcriptional regulator [Bradyrhizobium sp. U87765 SZCCT0131]MBR1261963.1 helix-turn-helix transcriptional regulator [Bradyrhizobium sp. U87765 SZCCT0134]MBR1306184.1 helix-turn-helix transcriptional regulator [Bradyrhizobium sp. U87765 SZCCT0110]MBR1317745.1 helix-turn-helix transcriptional regulator [Bradyrhizobium sp. U87765 SZCCT0109]MBR1351447.1 helix-turn-h